MAQQKRTEDEERLRLAIRDKERRLAFVALDKAIHELAEVWKQPHITDAAKEKKYRDALKRAWEAEKN